MTTMPSRSALVMLVALALAACDAGEPTQIMLVVESDLSPGIELDAVLVRAYLYRDVDVGGAPDDAIDLAGTQPGNVRVLGERYYVTRFDEVFPVGGPGELSFPLEIGIAPRFRDATRIAYFEAYALRCGGDRSREDCADAEIVTSTAARTSFVRRKNVSLVLFLSASCRDVECVPGVTTCRGGVCRPVDVPEGCLVDEGVDARGGLAPMCDEGAIDGGVDGGGGADAGPVDGGGIDAGPRDGGVDGGPPMMCECTPSDVDRQSEGCGRCGTRSRSRTCQTDCTWGAWGSYGSCDEPSDTECDEGDTSGFASTSGCPSCTEADCTVRCDSSCRWNWSGSTCGSCEAPAGEAPCTDRYGRTVCHGQRGALECGTMPTYDRLYDCSNGSWINPAGGCI
jgi:hypothetical protein